MGLNEHTNKAKADKNANATNGSGTSASAVNADLRARALKGNAPVEGRQVGLKHLYKPAEYVVETVDGVKRCYTVDKEGNKHFTAPEIHCVPYATVEREPGQGMDKPYTIIFAEVKTDTFVTNGGIDKEVKAGDTIMMIANKGLERVESAANLDDNLREMWIRALDQTPIPNSKKTIWNFSVIEGPTKIKREIAKLAPAQGELPPELQD